MKNNRFLNRKTLLSLVAIGALLAMMIAPTFATEIYIVNYDDSNRDSASTIAKRTNETYPGNGNRSYIYQSFICLSNSSYNLTTISFWINAPSLAPVGLLAVDLCYHDGSLGTSSTPGAVITTSNMTYDTSALTSTYVWANFTFASNTTLTASTAYVAKLYFQSATTLYNPDYRLGFGIDASSPTLLGNNGDDYLSATPVAQSGYDAIIRVYGTNYTAPAEEEEETPTLPTEGGYDYTDQDSVINAVAGFLLPLILILLPPALLCLITRRVDKWLIIIGLTIGSALLYLFLGTQYLWLVFLIVIGLVGMAYQSVRGGG